MCHLVTNSVLGIKGKGKILIVLPNSKTKEITNVWYPKSKEKSSISESVINQQNMKIEFSNQRCLIHDKSNSFRVTAQEFEEGGLYRLGASYNHKA